jgi:VWFA-related protein
MLIRLFTLLVFLTCVLTIYAQTTSDQVIKINSNLVALDAQVIDSKTNKAVPGLKKEDFLLYDEKVLQDITFFKEEALPLSVILLFEVSNTLSPLIDNLHPEEWPITKLFKDQDEVAIMAFGSRTELVQPFTKDRRVILSKLRDLPKIDSKLAYQREAIYQASQQMRRAINPSGRRAIIVITSNFSSEPLFTSGNLATKEETLEQLYESGATVTSILFGSTGDKILRELAAKRTPDQILISKFFSKSNIHIFANETGGEVIPAIRENFLEKLTYHLESLRTRYSLAFVPSVETSEKFREIQLKLSDKLANSNNFVVKTRKGYYPGKPTFISYNQLILPKTTQPIAAPYKIVNLMPKFEEFLEKVKDQDLAAQTKLFQETFVKVYPEIFNTKVLNIDTEGFEEKLNSQIQIFLSQVKREPSYKLKRLTNALVNELSTNEEKFLSRFSNFNWDGTIYFAPLLSTSISKQEVIEGKKVLIFGLDTIAFTRKDEVSFWPIFHHQLFHLYHQQFQPNVRHLDFEQPLYDFIWNEGLATYVTSLLDAEISKGELIQLDSLKGTPKATLAKIANALRQDLKTKPKQAYQNYYAFDTNTDIVDNYINTGNYLSLLIAERLVLGQTFSKTLELKGDDLERVVDIMLRRIELLQLK